MIKTELINAIAKELKELRRVILLLSLILMQRLLQIH